MCDYTYAYINIKMHLLCKQLPICLCPSYDVQSANMCANPIRDIAIFFPLFTTGRFGNGVSSYFRFLRWLFLLNIAIFLLMFTFVVVPHIAFVKYGLGDVVSTTSSDNSSSGVMANVTATTSLLDLRQTCSDAYVVTYDTSVAQALIDFVQGTVSSIGSLGTDSGV